MDSTGGTVKRIELSGERWVEVRRINAGDMRATRLAAHERGWEDETLDALFNLPRVIVAASGEINYEELTELDVLLIWAAAKGAGVPNPSAGSSSGTRRSRPSKAS